MGGGGGGLGEAKKSSPQLQRLGLPKQNHKDTQAIHHQTPFTRHAGEAGGFGISRNKIHHAREGDQSSLQKKTSKTHIQDAFGVIRSDLWVLICGSCFGCGFGCCTGGALGSVLGARGRAWGHG